jgi:hypothetical protein
MVPEVFTMKTTIQKRLAKGFAPVLLLAVCLSLSSCIWAPYGHRHDRDHDHDRDHRDYRSGYSQDIRR